MSNWTIKFSIGMYILKLFIYSELIFYCIAFSYAFFYLKNNFTYEEAMKRMLLQGGDTDTNAAIVGGLLGARWGIKRIPEKWVNSLNFNNSRKHFVTLKNVQELEENIEALLKKASSLK